MLELSDYDGGGCRSLLSVVRLSYRIAKPNSGIYHGEHEEREVVAFVPSCSSRTSWLSTSFLIAADDWDDG